MKLRYSFLLFLGLLWVTVSGRATAQSRLHPGYIVRTGGDTTRGFLYDRGPQANARECRFTADKKTTITTFTPQELRAYGFAEGKRYDTKIAVIGSDSVARPAFFECLVRGDAGLYLTQDAGKSDHYYLVMGAAAPVELANHLVMVNVHGTTVQKGDRQYQKVLSQAFQKCLMMQASLNSVRLSSSDLGDAVRRYNLCVGSKMTVGATRLPNKLTLSAMGGVQKSVQEIIGAVNPLIANYHLRSKASPVLGIGLQFESPALSKRLSVRLEGYYESQKYDSDFTDVTISFPAQQQIRVSTSYVHVPLLLRFTSPKGFVRPFVEGGIVLAVPVSVTQESRSRLTTFGSGDYTAWSSIADKKAFASDQGYMGSVGVVLGEAGARNFSLRLRSEYNEGFGASSGNVTTSVVRTYFLVSYDLTK